MTFIEANRQTETDRDPGDEVPMLPRAIQFWRLGIRTLRLHPLRSLLTVSGVFIGVASVIWLLAIGEGISRKAQEQIEGLGADNVIVRSMKPSSEQREDVRGVLPYGLTRDDISRITETIPTVRTGVPIRELRRRFRHADQMLEGRLVGCTPDYASIVRLAVDRGRFLTAADGNERGSVCVLAAESAARLFPLEDPLGRTVRIEDTRWYDYYTVVGVLQPRAPTAAIGGSLAAQDFSQDVYVPIETLWLRLGDLMITRRSGRMEGEHVEVNQVTIRVDAIRHVIETAAIVNATLAGFHPDRDFAVIIPLELLEQARTTRWLFILFLGLVAAVSLIVGGIGIMNIMLATVTERTVEIGIRRALGAKRRDIIRQFLAETVLLASVGGICGVLGGFLCGPTFQFTLAALESFFPAAVRNLPDAVRDVSPIIVPWSIPLAFGISVSVGLVFGVYPARRAAALDPIEALRHT